MKVCFNTEKGPKAVGPYSTLTMTNDLVFVSGMIPLDPATNEIVEGGIEAQARQSLENIKTVLEEVGLTMNHALKTTVLLTDLNSFSCELVVNLTFEIDNGKGTCPSGCVDEVYNDSFLQ